MRLRENLGREKKKNFQRIFGTKFPKGEKRTLQRLRRGWVYSFFFDAGQPTKGVDFQKKISRKTRGVLLKIERRRGKNRGRGEKKEKTTQGGEKRFKEKKKDKSRSPKKSKIGGMT